MTGQRSDWRILKTSLGEKTARNVSEQHFDVLSRVLRSSGDSIFARLRKLVIFLTVFANVAAQAQTNNKRPVSVEDSVMLRLFTASNTYTNNGEMTLSPDGKRLVYALRETNLEKNRNEVVLYLLEIPASIGEQASVLGKGREVFRSAALPLTSPFIQQARNVRSNQFRWLADGRYLLVLHQPDGEKNPVISRVNLNSGKAEIVYRPGIEVTEFAADQSGNHIVVAGRAPSNLPGPLQSPRGILLTNAKTPYWALDNEYLSAKSGLWQFQLKVRDDKEREITLFKTKPNRSSGETETRETVTDVNISPDGRSLLCTTNASGIKTPESWQGMRDRGSKILIYDLGNAFDYQITSRNENHRLAFDSPIRSGNVYLWSDDSSAYLLIGPTPVRTRKKNSTDQEKQNERNPKLYSINSQTGEASLVAVNTSDLQEIYAFDQRGSRIILRMKNGELVTFRRGVPNGNSAGWSEEKRSRLNVAPLATTTTLHLYPLSVGNDRVIIDIEQSPTMAPDLWATDIASGQKTRLTEANPELSNQRMPKIERIEMSGSYGKTYWGHLIYPLDYVQGRRYPAVIMMKDWHNWFIHTTGFYYNDFPPLQLSATGILVFMLNTPGNMSAEASSRFPELAGARGEIRLTYIEIDGIKVAKKQLMEKGLIDPDRVGLMSFSHSVRSMNCELTQPSTERKPEWAAAIGMDGDTASYFQYLQSAEPVSDQPYYERQKYGGPPFGTTRRNWEKYSNAWNADKVRTPTVSVYHGSTVWDAEWVRALQVQGKPVEQIWFPDVGHWIQPPLARQSWIHWAVDWMRFWLQDYERPNGPLHDPDRYVRWRKMRQQHRWNEKLIAEGKNPAQEFMNLRIAGIEPIFDSATNRFRQE